MSPTRTPLDALGHAHVRSGSRVLDVGRRVDIRRLPFGDSSFDVVVCRQRLQLVSDRDRVLAEIRRVLVAGGRAAISVVGPIERSPEFAALADAMERHAGVHAATMVRWLFSLPEPGDLEASLAAAGFTDIRVTTARATTLVPSVSEMMRFVPGSRVGVLPTEPTEATRRNVIAELEHELAGLLGPDGLRVGIDVNTAIARR